MPISDVTEPGAINNILYSVTASSQTVAAPNAETPSATNIPVLGTVAGQLPNLIDVAPAFDFNPSTAVTPEAPWMPILVAAGLVPALGALLVRRRRRVEVAEQR